MLTCAGRGKRGKGKWTPTYTTTWLQRQKPPGVRAQEEETAAAGPSRSPAVQEPQHHDWRKYIEICKWSDRVGTWVKTLNLPIQLTERTANIRDASGIVSAEAFGGEQAILLDCDYLKVPDTYTTRGT